MNDERRAKGDTVAWDPVYLLPPWLPTTSEQHKCHCKSSYVTKAQQPECKMWDSGAAMFQVEGQRDSFRVSPWGAWISDECRALFHQNPTQKNVHKMATPHTMYHHQVATGLGIPPRWFKTLKLYWASLKSSVKWSHMLTLSLCGLSSIRWLLELSSSPNLPS